MSDFSKIEQTIGYTFENKDLLQQAFVRKSYSEEHGGQNNEVLEFIGDKALEFAVVRIMMEQLALLRKIKNGRSLSSEIRSTFKQDTAKVNSPISNKTW